MPDAVYFDGNSAVGHTSRFWAGYSGQPFAGPRADRLRAACSCGWAGTEYRVDWDRIGDKPVYEDESARRDAENCQDDWYRHIDTVEASTVAYPREIAELLQRAAGDLDSLATREPAAALKAATRLEILAASIGYHAAHAADRSMEIEDIAAALGIEVAQTEDLLDRYQRQ
ncbi:hypothetical protein [Streptomyces sp. NPDC051546]|uniref:hypothetical protein n=1 Tax=Streptomyces sp. NPDC051546 TaxID=3365655 RepID=UPI00378A8E95